MDNARPGNIILLNGAADRVIRDNTVLLDEIADLLKAHCDTAETDAQAPDLVHDVSGWAVLVVALGVLWGSVALCRWLELPIEPEREHGR